MFNTLADALICHGHITVVFPCITYYCYSICQISQQYISNTQINLIYVKPHKIIQCKCNGKNSGKVTVTLFQNFIKKHKPHKIKEATMGSKSSSGTTYIISKLLLPLFAVDLCFLFDRCLFFFILLRFIVHKKVHFLCVSYQYFDTTFPFIFRSNLN